MLINHWNHYQKQPMKVQAITSQNGCQQKNDIFLFFFKLLFFE